MDYKKGQRIKVTLEGVAEYDSSENGPDAVYVRTDGGDSVYVETSAREFDSAVTVEIIKAPLRNGLYYLPVNDETAPTQGSLVYKLEGGDWFDHKLDYLPDFDPEGMDLIQLAFGEPL